MKKWIALILAMVLMLTLFGCSKTTTAPAAAETSKQAETSASAASAASASTAGSAAQTGSSAAASTSSDAADGKKVIGISALYRRDEYYTDLCNALSMYGEEYGYEIHLMDADLDAAVQQQQLEDFVTSGVDVIALSPIDPAGLVSVCDTIGESGIPIFVFDGQVDSDAVVSNIVFDNTQNGVDLGNWTKDYIAKNFSADETVKIAILDFPASSTVSVPIANGFASVMDTIANVKIVTRQDANASRSEAMSATENILTANPDLDIVMGINYDTGAGARAAIEAAGSDAIVVAAGWAQEGFEQLTDNDSILKCLCVNQPALQGEDTMKAIKAYLNGEQVSKVFESTPVIVDASNVKDFGWEEVVARRTQS